MHDTTIRPYSLAEPDAWAGDIISASLAVTFIAQVCESDGTGDVRVSAGGRPLAARRAPSCLLEPEGGDRVACWRASGPGQGADADVYIVAVLSRRDGVPARLRIDGSAELAASGRLRLVSKIAIDVHAPEFEVDAARMSFSTRALSLAADAIRSVAAACRATFGDLQMVGATCSTVFTSEHHHAQSHSRSVEGVDRLDAQVVDHEAHELMNLRGKNVLANGSLVKLQAGQLHLG